MYYWQYINRIRSNDNDCDTYELLNQAADDSQVSDEEYAEVYEAFKEVNHHGQD
jgi:hypothetical protein